LICPKANLTRQPQWYRRDAHPSKNKYIQTITYNTNQQNKNIKNKQTKRETKISAAWKKETPFSASAFPIGKREKMKPRLGCSCPNHAAPMQEEMLKKREENRYHYSAYFIHSIHPMYE